MLMKNKFSKFINLQGKYLTSLLFVLFFAIGQMWGVTYTYDFDAATDFTTQTTTKDKNNVTLAQTSYTLNATETGAPSKTFDVVICSVEKNKERSVSYESGKGLKFDRCGALAFSLSEPSIVKILVTSKACVFGKDPAYGTTYTASNYQSFGSNPTTALTAGSEITINCDAGNYKICCPDATGGAYRVRSIKITPAAKVTFDGNGATSGTMQAVYLEKGVAANLPANAFEKTDNDFGGWKDASNNSYTDGQSVTLSASLALTAQWIEPLPRYAVKYNKGANGTGTIADGEKIDGTPFTLSSDMFTRESYLQVGWTETDGNARDYMLGGKYTTDAAITLYPAWAQKVTDVAAFSQASGTPAGWTFSNDGYSSDSKATVAYVKDFSDNSLSTPVNNGMDNDWVAFAKNTSACATYDLGYATTVSALSATLYGGSSSAFDQKIEYVAADGSTVLKTYTNSLGAGNWASNSISKTDIIPNVRYIKVYGASKWVVMSAFSVTYGDLSTKYTVNFVKGAENATGTMAAVEYKEGATVTAPACGFERDGYTFSKWSVSGVAGTTEVLKDGTFAMPANTVTLTAQWIETSVTYDIAYVSAHGTTPAADNAASVVLAELDAEGWAHKGWIADVDVTVDAATVTAGTLIANGKTAILASDVEFTAVWKQIFTLTFNSKDGSAVAPQYIEDGGNPTAVEAPTKDDYVFQGWSETDGGDVVADITAITISDDKTFYAKWKLDVQVSELVFSNSFKGWIHDGQVEVFYMAGESAPTIVSYAGKNLKAEGGVVISGDKVIATGTDDSEKEYALTMTAVTPLTATGAQTFDGTEGYVKTRHAWTAERKWKMSRYAEDGRVAKGETSMYIFLGAAESVTLDWGAQKVTNDVAVYVNGEFVKNIGKNNNSAIELSNGNNMVALYSLQTSGDIWLNGLTVAPWVPVTAVTLKEGEDAISSKSIWESTSFTLTAEVTPDNASNKTITWTSSNDAIATVVNGVVTGVAASADPVTITASTVDGVNATCVVTVTEAPSPCETPTITADPASQAYCAGSEPTLSVDASVTDGGTLHYAWFKDDVAIGSDAATCVVTGAGTYKVVVTNKKGGKLDASVTSANAVVTLNTQASITTQPTNKRDVVAGSEVTLSVVATNATSYQWYSCDDAEKTNASAIDNEDGANYVFNCTANAYYYCVVGNACGADLESNVVSVKLEPEGCNLVGTPSGNAYTQAGEWSIYPVNSNGQHDPEGSNFGTCKAFDEETDVNCVNTRRFAIKFEKDVESVTIYARGGTGRTFDKVSVADEMAKNAYTELTDITKQLITIDGAGKEYIATAEGMIPGGKYAWFDFSGSFSGVFKICYTAALVEPKLPTLVNQELCAGAAYQEFDATITNEDACTGTVSYQWYNAANDEAIEGANVATFTPSAEGSYYVVVRHAAAGHMTREVKSANINVAHFDALAISSVSEDVFQHMGTATTLSVVATGKNVAYKWYTCDDAAGNGAVAIDPAETEAELAIASILEGVHYYMVEVSHDCDATVLSRVIKVEGWDQLEQVDVTETTTWDMTNVSANHIELTGSDKNARLLLANIDGVNNTTFNAQALKFEGQHIGRTEGNVKHLAGRYVQFNVTVPGAVFVTFASNGNNARTIAINGKKCARTTSGTAADKYITYALAVEPGSVEIVGYEDESANQYVRISKIEFKAEASHTRSGLNPSFLGTLCWTNNAVLGGATLYEFAGKDEYNKLVFDEVAENRLEAGKPYIFMPENGNTEIKLYNTDSEEPLTEDQAPVNHMYGTITGKTLVPGVDDNMYYFSSNHIWAVKDFVVNIPVPAYYCYIDYPAVLADQPAPAAPAPGRRRVTMGVQGEQVVTGVENLNASEQPVKLLINGQIFILRGEKMYDATGRLVK